MKIKNSIALYTWVITLIPILTLLMFLNTFRTLEIGLSSLSEDAVVQKEFLTFQTTVRHWFVISDLVMASSETYLADDAINLGENALDSLAFVCRGSISKNIHEGCNKLVAEIITINQYLKEAQSILEVVNTPRIRLLLASYDEVSEEVVSLIHIIEKSITDEKQKNTSIWQEKRKSLIKYLWIAAFLNVLLIFVCWRYLSTLLVKPITKLTEAAKSSLDNRKTFNLTMKKPTEVDDLAKSINTFVTLLDKRAYYDPLTELPNRAYFNLELKKQLSILERNRLKLALLFFDLDNFKIINDTYGHYIGDKLLLAFAERINGCVRSKDTFVRLGGDEFILIVVDITDRGDIDKIINKIYSELILPVDLDVVKHRIGTSIGISITDNYAMSNSTLLKQADQALYWSKNNGRNRHYYFDDMKAKIKVMYIDDDSSAQQLTLNAFKNHAYFELVVAGTAIDGLATTIKAKPSIVLIALCKGNKDGEELTKTLASIPAFLNTPICAVTGAEVSQKQLNDMGFTIIFRKPIDYPELIIALEVMASIQ
jgi:diguanylate cyclase (GGDEF)-like protein